MVLFNYAIREVTAKLVYYGPGLCGKTTNLQFIHEKLDPSARGKLLSLATDGDRTLFFDFLPIEMGSIGGYKVRFQLYTVPGQVHYNATRKLVLKGVDAVAFVADSQLSMVERNRESFENLIENLIENGYDPAKVPIVIQLNKRDLPNVASVGDLVAAMGVEGYPSCEAVANRGDGVFETLKTIVKLTLSRLRTQFDAGSAGLAGRSEVPPPPPPPPPPAPSVVFAPPVSAPPPPAAPIPPPAVELEPPAAAVDGLDEFDLEDFSDQVATPVPLPADLAAAGGAEGAYGEIAFAETVPEEHGVLDLEADMEALLVDQPVAGEGVPDEAVDFDSGGAEGFTEAALEPEVSAEVDWFAEAPSPVGLGPDIPVAAASTDTPPPWAVEMMEELRQLRAENKGLRDALRGMAALLERQIGVLQEGREELERHVGDVPGESGS